jgi:hypothetical protein
MEAAMELGRDQILLRRFRLSRADIVASLGASSLPPHPKSVQLLAELQLAIMAIEGAIADKADAGFFSEYLEAAA